MAQLAKRLTLDFGSGHDFAVREFEPHIGLWADIQEPAWYSLSPLSAPSPLILILSLSLSLSLLSLSLSKIK